MSKEPNSVWYQHEGLDRVSMIQNQLEDNVSGMPFMDEECEKILRKAQKHLSKLYQKIGEWEPEPFIITIDHWNLHEMDKRTHSLWFRVEGPTEFQFEEPKPISFLLAGGAIVDTFTTENLIKRAAKDECRPVIAWRFRNIEIREKQFFEDLKDYYR